MRKNIWFPLILITVLWLVGIGGAWAAVVIQKSMNASVIILEPNFLFYSDLDATHPIDKINLPEVSPGSVNNFTFYVKNISPVSQTISAGNFVIPASTGTITMTFDGQPQKTLAANAFTRADGTLIVIDQAQTKPKTYTILINAVPVTTTLITSTTVVPTTTTVATSTTLVPTTTTPATSTIVTPTVTTPTMSTTVISTTTVSKTSTQTVLNGQAIYNANCLSCHRSLPTTNSLTQAQLSTFIANHNTSRNLTGEQVTSIVLFLKP
jgi:hypothetical protein